MFPNKKTRKNEGNLHKWKESIKFFLLLFSVTLPNVRKSMDLQLHSTIILKSSITQFYPKIKIQAGLKKKASNNKWIDNEQ